MHYGMAFVGVRERHSEADQAGCQMLPDYYMKML